MMVHVENVNISNFFSVYMYVFLACFRCALISRGLQQVAILKILQGTYPNKPDVLKINRLIHQQVQSVKMTSHCNG